MYEDNHGRESKGYIKNSMASSKLIIDDSFERSLALDSLCFGDGSLWRKYRAKQIMKKRKAKIKKNKKKKGNFWDRAYNKLIIKRINKRKFE